jgi:hypothetical protein
VLWEEEENISKADSIRVALAIVTTIPTSILCEIQDGNLARAHYGQKMQQQNVRNVFGLYKLKVVEPSIPAVYLITFADGNGHGPKASEWAAIDARIDEYANGNPTENEVVQLLHLVSLCFVGRTTASSG